jgi:hypothetical protein
MCQLNRGRVVSVFIGYLIINWANLFFLINENGKSSALFKNKHYAT